ncbi:hypothetical protein P7C73_g2468, partial [Tremellales sp. Uapishka_1]
MSLLGPRYALRSIYPALHPLPQRSCPTLRAHISTVPPQPARQVLGRITPKRIAIEVPPGSPLSSSRNGTLPEKSIWRPLLFCLVLGGGGYLSAAAYTNADTANWAEKLGSGSWWRKGKEQPAEREIMKAKSIEKARKLQATLNGLQANLTFLPELIRTPILRTYIMVSEYTLNTPASQQVPLAIISVMGTVFLAWKVPRWEPFMRRWFLHHPVVFGARSQARRWGDTVTLFTSVISHQSLPHLAFNSLALYSFGFSSYAFISTSPPSSAPLPSSTHAPHFIAFLLAGGLASSLASHMYTNLFRLPKLLKLLKSPARLSSAQALAAHQAILPSLGASGAIYAAVTMTACAYPDAGVSIIFLPFFSVPIGWGVGAMVGLDLLGLIRGWKMFDHVAHLAGAAFGMLYYGYGREVWAWTRRKLGARERGSGFV